MSYTRSALRLAILAQADDSGGSRWDTTVGGEIDRTMSMVYDREWKRILNVNRFYRMGQRTVNSNGATGRIAISALDSGTGNTLERTYRVISVRRNNVLYDSVKQSDFTLAEDIGSQHHIWYREGSSIFLLPQELGAEYKIWVNWIPQRPTGLTTDSDTIDFPTDYEDILRYETAGWLMMKGAAEAREAQSMFQIAQLIRNDMLEDIARLSTDPDYLDYADRGSDWAGQ